MTTGTSCRLCWGGETESFLYLPRFPAFVERLLDSGEVASDQPVTLDVRRCNACGFIHLPFSPLPADFYRHYDKSAVNASSMKRYQNELARKIVFDHCLGNKRALEVGCGDGYFAGQLKNLGVDVTAVEPGNTSAIRTRNRGIPVIEEYFSSTLDLKPGSFNTIIARQVLSHIEDIHGFAAAAHRFLAPNGVIILEVPDVGEAMARGRYYDFFADYVNYFDGGTLVRLFSHHGFIPYEISRGMGGQYLIATFSKDPHLEFAGALQRQSRSVRQLIDKERSDGRRIAMWGAGGRGISLLAFLDLDATDIAYVVDSATEKQGRLTPLSHIPIVAPDHLATERVDVVVVSATMFQEEIITTLRETYSFRGKVLALEPHPHFISLVD